MINSVPVHNKVHHKCELNTLYIFIYAYIMKYLQSFEKQPEMACWLYWFQEYSQINLWDTKWIVKFC
jgi:hypothetical protein